METTKQRPEWMKDPLVRDIHPKKLDFLEQLFQEAHGKSQKELMAFLMPMLRKAKKETEPCWLDRHCNCSAAGYFSLCCLYCIAILHSQ